MNRKQKLIIGVTALTVGVVAVLVSMSIASHKVQGNILVRDGENNKPVSTVLTLFEVSRTPTTTYPLDRTGPAFACMTDGKGSIRIPDLQGTNWISATHFRIRVFSDGHKRYVKEFPRKRFGEIGTDCKAIKVMLEQKEN